MHVANTCTCENGVATTGADCTTDAASMCASCDDGFTINGDDTACGRAFMDYAMYACVYCIYVCMYVVFVNSGLK